MTEFYVFVKEHRLSGWIQDETIWQDHSIAVVAAIEIGKKYPEAEIVVCESKDGAFPRPTGFSIVKGKQYLSAL